MYWAEKIKLITIDTKDAIRRNGIAGELNAVRTNMQVMTLAASTAKEVTRNSDKTVTFRFHDDSCLVVNGFDVSVIQPKGITK